MFELCSWFFEHRGQGSNLSRTRPFFTRAKSDAVYGSGLSTSHGYLSMAVFVLIYRSHSYRWASSSPIELAILSVKPQDSHIQHAASHVYAVAVLNKSWRQHPTRLQLYGHLPPITKTIQVRRTRHAGHCWRSKDELISDVLLWTPTHGCARVGRPARTYIQQLCEDTGCNPEDLPEAMNDREKWRETVRDIRAGGATWWWWWIQIQFIKMCQYSATMSFWILFIFVDAQLWQTVKPINFTLVLIFSSNIKTAKRNFRSFGRVPVNLKSSNFKVSRGWNWTAFGCEAHVIYGVWSYPSLPFTPDPLWSRVVLPVRFAYLSVWTLF